MRINIGEKYRHLKSKKIRQVMGFSGEHVLLDKGKVLIKNFFKYYTENRKSSYNFLEFMKYKGLFGGFEVKEIKHDKEKRQVSVDVIFYNPTEEFRKILTKEKY